jgi:hypothetical protein
VSSRLATLDAGTLAATGTVLFIVAFMMVVYLSNPRVHPTRLTWVIAALMVTGGAAGGPLLVNLAWRTNAEAALPGILVAGAAGVMVAASYVLHIIRVRAAYRAEQMAASQEQSYN